MERVDNKEAVKEDTRKLAVLVICMLMFVVVIFGVIPLVETI